jgi:hypothetical protein
MWYFVPNYSWACRASSKQRLSVLTLSVLVVFRSICLCYCRPWHSITLVQIFWIWAWGLLPGSCLATTEILETDFKIENLEIVHYLVRKEDWLVKLDLKDAYLTVQCACLSTTLRKNFFDLTGEEGGVISSLDSYGLRSSACLVNFTKILKLWVAFLRKPCIRLVVYLDDLLNFNVSENGMRADVKIFLDLLISLGFFINWDKSVTVPTHVIKFLEWY